jgi:two-component system CheB/CheR fusion protein
MDSEPLRRDGAAGSDGANAAEARLAEAARQHAALYRFVARLQTASSLSAIYDAGLDAMLDALRCDRASVLVADAKRVMRFAGWRGISEAYRKAVDGHSAWAPDEREPEPVLIPDIAAADVEDALKAHVQSEGIVALGFFPLMVEGRLGGKFMTYYDSVHAFGEVEVEVALSIARQLSLAIGRYRGEETLRASEQRLRLALEAGGMGSWEWNLPTNQVVWSPELEALHGLAPGTFDGTFDAYRRDIHPDDFENVQSQIARSLDGTDHRLEYRIVRPDGTLRWVEGRGKVFRDASGAPVRLIGVCTDITERKVQEAAAAEAERRKDEFLATLAHELRNPLAPISNALHLLKTFEGDRATRARAYEIMERQLGHMVRLVDDLLDVSRITRGALQLRMDRVDLASIVGSAVETSLPIAQQRRHDLVVDAILPLHVQGDAVRLAQTFANLINNACKFTPEGGRIRVTAEGTADEAVIKVMDNGIGIDAAHLDSIFDMFSQVDHAMTRSQAGLGIGLALARRIVELHGGTISAGSDGLGKGATFSIRLPLAADHRSDGAPPSQEQEADLGRRRILVVEDNEDAASTLAMMLTSAGNEVAVSHDAHAALETAARLKPDTVLLDLGLPRMSGYDVCRRLRKEPWAQNVVIVALSGWGQQQDRRESSDAGFDAHLVKPVRFDTLAATLSKARMARGSAPAPFED